MHHIKDLALSLQRLGSLLWCRFESWLRNFHVAVDEARKKKKKGTYMVH